MKSYLCFRYDPTLLLSIYPFYSEILQNRSELSANGYDLQDRTKSHYLFCILVPDIKQEPSSPVQDPSEEAQQQGGGWGRGKGDCLYEGRHGQRQTFKLDNRHQLRLANISPFLR